MESWDWNRRPGESVYQHFLRILYDKYPIESKDLSFSDLNPEGLMKLNSLIGCEPNTYYFSITTGFKRNVTSQSRELFKLPKQISNKAMGFDLDFPLELTFNSKSLKTKQNLKPSFLHNLKNQTLLFFKYLVNPTFSHFSFFQETQTQIDAL